MPNSFISQESLWQWHSTSCSYFLRTLRVTPPWHWHTTRHLSCPPGTFGAYTRQSFPDYDTTQHSSRSSCQTFFLKPPLPSQWPTIPFSLLFFPDSLPFLGKFSLTMLRNHPLSLGFSPFWHIDENYSYSLDEMHYVQRMNAMKLYHVYIIKLKF